jgi:phosphate starvation-inducible PhoH-like protein
MSNKKSGKKYSYFKVPLHSHQKEVINFLRSNEISILEGNAGTAKDHCCLYRGLDAIDTGEHSELILIKPIIELGQKMGYLPGESSEKTQPYEESFNAIINKLIGKTKLTKYNKKIRFEPINFMRGNTYEYSTVILSEAQNCTLHELISVVTRVASNSKLLINGDTSQSDIGHKSGFKKFISIIKDVDGVGHMELGSKHQVRNPMIVDITERYKKYLNGKL